MLRNTIIIGVVAILIFYIYPSTKDLPTSDKPFKTKNANRIWQMAKESLTDEDLSKLFEELQVKDKQLIEWKRKNADKGAKKDEEKETLLADIKAIKKKYKLGDDTSKNEVESSLRFNDSRLQSIWNDVSKSPYYHPYEVDQILTEVDGLQVKIDEVQRKTTEEDESESKPYKKVDKDVKKTHDQVQEDIKVLEQKHKFTVGMMQNHQIQELWNLALQYKLTGLECESIKEDLRHMHAKIMKQARLIGRLASLRRFDPDTRDGEMDMMVDPEYQDLVAGHEKIVNKWYSSIYRRITGAFPEGMNRDEPET